MRVVLWLLVGFGLNAISLDAQACATCACGDPTLTVMGAEKPFAGRLRAAMTTSYRTDVVEDEHLKEWRFDLSAAYAITDRIVMSVALPMVHRTFEDETLNSLGDLEFRARLVMWQDSSTLPSHMLSAIAAVTLPTAPHDHDQPDELQAGTGTVDPAGGLAYSFFNAPWSVYVSSTLYRPAGVLSLRSTARLQYQLTDWLAVRAGPDSRLDARDHHEEENSGGFIGFASGEVVVSPFEDVLLTAMVHVPVFNRLHGQHHEGTRGVLGIVYDF